MSFPCFADLTTQAFRALRCTQPNPGRKDNATSVDEPCASGLLLASVAGAPAQAQSVADFYRGKTVNVLIGVGVGGEYDLQARLVARHIGKHIPGNPDVVPQNMTGAGGIKMANYLYTSRPQDGTNIGMLGNNFPATQAVGVAGRAVRRRQVQLARHHRAGGRDHGGLAHDRREDDRRLRASGDRRRRRRQGRHHLHLSAR